MNSCKIIAPYNIGKNYNKFLVELSALIGFYSISMEFPVLSFDDKSPIENDLKQIFVTNSTENKIDIKNNLITISLVEEENQQMIFFETIAETIKNIVENSRKNVVIQKEQLEFSNEALEKLKQKPENRLSFGNNKNNKGVHSIFSNGFFTEDKDNDLLPDLLNLKIFTDSEMSHEEIITAANISARFTMDLTEYHFPVTTSDKTDLKSVNSFIIEELKKDNSEKGIWINECGDIKTIYLKESKEKLVEFSSYICENLSKLNFDINHKEFCKSDSSKPKDKIVFQKDYDIPWEVDIYKGIIKEELLPILKKGDKVHIMSALSEDLEIRNNLKLEIKELLSEKEIYDQNIELFCSYKEGYSWIDEKIIPKLIALGKNSIDKIDISFRSFLPKGEKEWKDENGAVPSYNIANENNPNRWFDLPIRYLQELYPIDDTISEKLNFERDRINFKEYKGDSDISYEIVVYGKNNELLLKENFKVEYSERPYIDDFSDLGLVHPTTGHLTIFVNNKKVIEKNIKTDLENIWDIYQKETLPMCKDEIKKITNGSFDGKMQPFFSKLQIELDISEPDYKLSSREDLISSIDSFHEDIYFVGLDYFKTLGQRLKGDNFDSPGLIYPVIKKSNDKPKMRVTLYGIENSKDNNKIIEYKNKDIYIRKISLENQELKVSYTTCSSDNITEEFLFKIENNSISDRVYTKIEEINLFEDQIIGYHEYTTIIEKLRNVEGIVVKEIGESYQKRKIHSIEFLPKYKGYVSQNKLINSRPVYLVNSRHHANEVSATNSSFMLIKELLTNPKYKDFTQKINLVIIPFENVDGGAIHYELQKDNPNWIFHTARFNSLGKEFGGEYFKDETIHTEAKALTNVWREWLPDIITDNHGVPSHEWAQQFSGYTSPSFKGFWLPRSLIYGYFWWLNDKEFLGNELLSKKMEKVVADSINAHENISTINSDWRDRFEKYAHKWMPKLFPANYFENLIMYWIPFKFDFNHKYASIRYPWITSVMFTSEVADETAQGDYLNLCAKTHFYHNIATIDMMINSKLVFDSEILKDNNGLKIKNTRVRPLI